MALSKFELVRKAVVCLGILYVFAAAAYLRFHWITKEGLTEGDSVGYYFIAKNWSEGDFTDFWGDAFYRPVVYGLDALAIVLWGDNDYSIKLINGIAELLSLALILTTSRLLTRNFVPGLIAALTYALSFWAVRLSRAGMPHALTAALVLGAVCLLAAASRHSCRLKSMLPLDLAAGISLGLAANTHADVALLGPGFVAALVLQSFTRSGLPIRAALWMTLARIAAFGGGCLIPYAAGFLFFGPEKVISVITAEIALGTWQPYTEQSPLYLVPYNVLAITSLYALGHAVWIPTLTILGAVCSVVLLGRRATRSSLNSYLLLFPVVSFLVLFPLLIGPFDKNHARLMIGFLPILYLMPAIAVLEFTRAYLGARVTGPVWSIAAIALTLAVSLGAVNPRDYFSHPGYYNPSRFRVVHDLIGSRVSASNRLLILPSEAYFTQGFNTDFYFGENAGFLGDQERKEPLTVEMLARIIREGDFSYLYFSDFGDHRFADAAWGFPGRNRSWWRYMKPEEYFTVDEQLITNETLGLLQAHEIFVTPRGNILSLRKRPVFPNSDFESGSLRNWVRNGPEEAFVVVETHETEEDRRSLKFRRKQTFDKPALLSFFAPPAQKVNAWAVDSRKVKKARTLAAAELVSITFRIEEDFIGFRISGTDDSANVHAALRVGGTEVRTSPIGDSPATGHWDVEKFRGEYGTLFIRDLDAVASSGIRVDGFYYVY